jgi:hypothetical protein
MTTDEKIFHLDLFLSAADRDAVGRHIGDMPLYRPGSATLQCSTTCYGGFGGHDLCEPMPPWLAVVRRQAEVNLGVFYGYFNAAAIICLEHESEHAGWLRLERIAPLSRVAVLTIGTAAVLQMRAGEPAVEYTSVVRHATLTRTNPGAAARHEWRFAVLQAPAVEPIVRKRKAVAVQKEERGAPPPSYQIVFMSLRGEEERSVAYQSMRYLYKTFRYGELLGPVMREPHLKLSLQHFVGASTSRKRQVLLSDAFANIKVKEEKQ